MWSTSHKRKGSQTTQKSDENKKGAGKVRRVARPARQGVDRCATLSCSGVPLLFYAHLRRFFVRVVAALF